MKTLICLLATLTVVAAWAQGTPPPPGSPSTSGPAVLSAVGVFSLLGDTVQATIAEDKPGATRLDPTSRESLDFTGVGFDLIALREARSALQRLQPPPRVDLFRAPTPLVPSDQRALADGATRAQLPDWIVKAINDNALSHVLLVTRGRGAMLAETASNESIGRGTVEGIGFYIDTLYTMQNRGSGALSTGLLAPYVQIRLQLMEVQSGDIVAEYAVRDSFAYANEEGKPQADPWNFMPTATKVVTMRGMVQKGMVRGMQAVLGRR
jgi:hypothetical protein